MSDPTPHGGSDGRERQGIQAAVVAYAGWGMLTLYWRQLHEYDPLELVGWRIASASVVMLIVMAAGGRLGGLRTVLTHSATRTNVVAASLLLTVNWSTYVWAVVHDHVIDTALGYFLAPLCTMAIGVVAHGERLTPMKWLSVGCAVAAIVVLVVSYGQFPWVAVLLAASWTSYGVFKRRVTLDPLTSLTGELLVLFVPAIAIVVLSFVRTDGIPNQATVIDWALVLGTGVITAVPLLLFAFAAQRVRFTVLGPLNYLIPIINFLLGWLAFHETLPPARLVGFLLVWIALIVIGLDAIPKIRRSAPSFVRHSGTTRLKGTS